MIHELIVQCLQKKIIRKHKNKEGEGGRKEKGDETNRPKANTRK